ncbi:MAG: class I SAM-dependent methyltransferase [Actinomycetota bacterium]|nr:class I SAM-dependent methyltransferase [Actinomycetota bacterium]
MAQTCGGSALELACGTGRITLPLADAGVSIVGLDRDPEMLAWLARHRHGANPPVIAADMRNFALARRFGVVFVAYNSIQLLTEWSDLVSCLSCARHHLAPGGLVGLEVTDFQASAADGVVGPEMLGQAEGICLDGSLEHDLAGRISRYHRVFRGPGWTVTDSVTLRSLDRGELAELLAASGLRATEWSGDGPTTRALATA